MRFRHNAQRSVPITFQQLLPGRHSKQHMTCMSIVTSQQYKRTRFSLQKVCSSASLAVKIVRLRLIRKTVIVWNNGSQPGGACPGGRQKISRGGASPNALYNLESLINKSTRNYICFYNIFEVRGLVTKDNEVKGGVVEKGWTTTGSNRASTFWVNSSWPTRREAHFT